MPIAALSNGFVPAVAALPDGRAKQSPDRRPVAPWQPPVPAPDSSCHITGDSTPQISPQAVDSKLPLGGTSAPIPKFASLCGSHIFPFWNQGIADAGEPGLEHPSISPASTACGSRSCL